MRMSRLVLLGLLLVLCSPKNAVAIPSFAAQTNQPCAACHVGSFGPQLKPYGRDFKLYGYVTSDRPNDNLRDNWYERLTLSAWTSFNRTNKDFPPSPGGVGYGPNDNFSLDQVAAYYGGRITPDIGAIQELSYDGATRTFFWDAMDIRHAWEGEIFGTDYVGGITLDNQLGNTSIWNSTPPFAFPYNASRIAPTPGAAVLLDDSLNGQILGPGAYISWNDWIYAEADLFFPLSHNFDQAVGNTQSDKYVTPLPYWHVALQHDFDHHQHYFQIGSFGTSADRQPAGDQTTGQRDHITDLGFEANYQWMEDLHNMISAHATYIHETQDLNASMTLGNSANVTNYLNTFRADVTYTIDDTYVPTVQYFKTTGSHDATLYSGANGFTSNSPDSEGFIIDLAYVPFGKTNSPVLWGNGRLAAQYTAYTKFNGTSRNASDNNTLFVNLIFDLAPLVPLFSHDAAPRN